MPKQHPKGFGFQPKPVTKFSDDTARTLELTLVKTFIGTMNEAIHILEDDFEWIDKWMERDDLSYSITKPEIDGWSTKLIWKELYKHGN